ncbi:cyclic nucleotide-binding domain-containing protein [Limnobacter humi]|uniref:Cyclic nucleotide-binding domain-containing protein n=1 Tax=Limnobacter humi TaxID=1778671 RepID=A0ABT1WDS6_9BURK|nr:cyclic nucleotide-binding domain-containing protein [Limnobacter humi]MCQ8895678.1 cyclic nucleotide-binding domain-containing protein [Limnobacter humi]
MNADIKAGALVALAGFAQALVYGMLAFAPLGQDGLAIGLYAGLVSALVGSALGALLGRAPVQFGGPRSSTALIVAGSIFGFQSQAQTLSLTALVGLSAMEVLLAGLLVFIAQRQGVGRLMQCLPAPVLIGMNTTLGLFSAYKLLPAMVGFAVFVGVPHAAAHLPEASWLVAAISGLTTLLVVYFRVVRPNPWGMVIALLAGLTVQQACQYGLTATTPLLGLTTAHWPHTVNWASAAEQGLTALWQHPGLVLQVGIGAGVIALLVVLESMQSLLTVDQTLNTRHDTARELNTLALATVVNGLLLALPSSNYVSRSNNGLAVGGKTRRSEAAYCAVLLALSALLWPVLDRLPIHILATVVAISSLFLIQGKTLHWVRDFFSPRKHGRMDSNARFTVWVLLGMVGATALSNLLVGTLVGVLFVAAYFLRQQSVGGLLALEHQPVGRSRTLRPRGDRQALDLAFRRVCRVTLDGSLFFGNAASLAIRLHDELKPCAHWVADFSRVRYVDDTAVQALVRALGSNLPHLKGHSVAVLPAAQHVPAETLRALEQLCQGCGLHCTSHLDDAFYWLENHLLGLSDRASGESPANPVHQALLDSHVCDGLPPHLQTQLTEAWLPLQLTAGETLFREGDAASGLFVLASGQMSAWHHSGNHSDRLMRFCPGSLIGEMALLDQRPRSATLVADTACTVLHLPLQTYHLLDPELATPLLRNLAKELTLRVRLSNQGLALTQPG